MPTKYGFETAEEKNKHREVLMSICDQIDDKLQEIIEEYLESVELPKPYSFVRVEKQTYWRLFAQEKPAELNSPLTVNLTYRSLGERSPQLFILIWSNMAVDTRNTLQLIKVLQEELGYPVNLKVSAIADEEDYSILKQAQLVD